MNERFGFSRILAAVAAVSIVSSAQAATQVWDANGSDAPGAAGGSGFWNLTNNNWIDTFLTTNSPWVNGNTAIFGDLVTPGVAGDSHVIDLTDAIVAQDILLGTASDGLTYSLQDFLGGSLTLNGNLTKASSHGAINLFLTQGLNLSAGHHVIAIRDTPGDVPELTVNSTITGDGASLEINNGSYETWGTTVFNFANTYTGQTTITKGRLIITDSGALGSGSAGTTIGETGTLALGGAGLNTFPGMNISEAIAITRSAYTDDVIPGAGNHNAAIQNNAQHNTLSGPLTLDTSEARILVNTSRLTISSDIQQGAGPAQLTLDGDFAGFVELTGNNTALTGGIRLIGGVQLEVSNQNNLGGPSSAITFAGSATLRPVGGFMTGFGSHVINNTTFSGGIYVDEGHSFSIDQELGQAENAVGSLGKRGPGTLDIDSPVNLRGGQTFWDSGVVNVNSVVTLHSLHLRSPTVNFGDGAVFTTTTGYSALGQDSTGTNGGPDIATVNITGNAQLTFAGGQDFNVSDNDFTQGTINIGDTATLTVGGPFFVSKDVGTLATINQSGGTVNANKTNDRSLAIGQLVSTTDTATGVYDKTGGTLNVAGEMWVGNEAGGHGTFNQSAGDTVVNNWFAVGRFGGDGFVEISGGTVTKQGNGEAYVGERATSVSVMTIKGTGAFVTPGSQFWVANDAGTGTLHIEDNGSLTVSNNWLAVGRNNNAVGVINLSGNGSITKAGNGAFTIGSGRSTGTVNQTGGTVTSNTTYIGEGGTGGTAVGNALYNISGGTASLGNVDIGRASGTGDATRTNGELRISGTGVVTANNILMGGTQNASQEAHGTINLNGGSLTAASIAHGVGVGTATFNFNGGTLSVGNFALPSALANTGTGRLAPGGLAAVGATAITSSYEQGATASLAVDLGGAASFDSVAVTGNATLAGKLTLGVVDAYDPALLAPHAILTSAAVSGVFDAIEGIQLAPSKWLAVTYSGTAVTVQAALPGDATLDNSVDFEDLLALAQNYNSTTGMSWSRGDFNGDAGVSFEDLLTLAQFYGTNALADADDVSGLSAAFQADWALAQSLVPEPASLSLIGLAGLAATRRRRR